jgi:transcription elongation factor GreA
MAESTKNEISPAGKADAEAELKERTGVRRREIVASIKVAREFGDLKENAEYHAAREAQAHNEARIRVLEHHLATATVSESAGSDDGSVAVGSKVSYRDSAAEKVSEVTIVHPLEADLASGKLSFESPVGQALMGAGKGDKVELTTARGSKQLEILDVG